MKRIAYLDCPAGVAGDMTLAALVAAGASIEDVATAVDAVAGFRTGIAVEPASESGIAGLRLRLDLPDEHAHRTLTDIAAMIESARSRGLITDRTANRASSIFSLLALAEAKIHGVKPDEVYFHEVGAMDSIADIVGVAAALDSLDIDVVMASPLPMTHGHVKTAHGLMPVPAPATVEVLKGWTVTGVDASGEFVTPTGAAICAALAGRASVMPRMNVESTGFGFGMLSWPDKRPNCVRVITGTLPADDRTVEKVVEISANIDDSTPEDISALASSLLKSGALDSWICPILMKKGRPGWIVSALCRPDDIDVMSGVFFTESSTIGVRWREYERRELEREEEEITTSLGPVRVKTAWLDGRIVNRQPEADDIRRIAAAKGLSRKLTRRIVESETR